MTSNTPPARRLLLVGDNALALQALSREGFEVVRAASPDDAPRQAQALSFDLVLLDAALAGSSPGTLLRRLKSDAAFRNTAFLLFSSQPDPAENTQPTVLPNSPSAPLAVPISIRDLVSTVRMQLQLRDLSRQLHERDERLRVLLHNEPECVKIVAADGCVLEMNPAGLDMIEADSENQVLGQSIFPIIHPDDRGAFEDAHQLALAGESSRLAFRVIGLKGTERWVESCMAPLQADDGSVPSVLSVTHDISRRRQAEADLVTYQLRQTQILESVGEGIHVLDAHGAILFENPAAARMFGWEANSMIGRSAHHIVHHHDADDHEYEREACPVYQTLHDGQTRRISGEFFFRVDGTRFPVEYVCSPVRADDGAITGAVVTFRDITEKLRVERVLAETNRALQVLALSKGALLHSEKESDLLAEVCRIAVDIGSYGLAWVGYARGDAEKSIEVMACAGRATDYISNLRLYWTEDQLNGRGPAGRTIRTGQPVIIPDFEGDETFGPWVEFSRTYKLSGSVSFPLKDGDRTFGLLALYIPQTRTVQPDELQFLQELADSLGYGINALRARAAQRRLEAALIRVAASVSAGVSEKFFEQLAASMTEAVGASAGVIARLLPGQPLTARTLAHIIQGQPAENFDYLVRDTPCESLQKSDVWVISSGVAEQFPTSAWLRRVGAQAYVGRTLLDSEGNVRGLLFVAFCEPLGSAELVSSTLQIFAARAAAELEREKLENQLHQAQRLESLGQLTGGIAHDFNNLLTVILGNAEMLTHAAAAADDRRRAATITSAAQRAADITQRLLTFARRQTLTPRLVDLNEMLATLTGLFRRTLGDDFVLQVSPSDGLWPARVDPGELQRALMNLVVNAREAMSPGGQVTLATSNSRLDSEFAAQHPEAVPGEYVLLTVTDTGRGIAPGDLARVFEPFFTTHDRSQGAGLGLAVVHGFIRQSGGYIDIISAPGRGTTVRLFLPRATNLEQRPASPPPPQKPATPGPRTILLVEDNEPVRHFASRQLTSLGYTVLQAEDARHALDILRDNAAIDLLFTDMIMPGGMNGAALAAEARKLFPSLKVLYTSGYADGVLKSADLDSAGSTPTDRVLGKPYRLADLANAIRLALGQ